MKRSGQIIYKRGINVGTLVFCLSVVMGYGCGSALYSHPLSVSPKAEATAEVVFFREWNFIAGGVGLPVVLDNRPLVTLANGTFVKVYLTPGTYMMRVGENEFTGSVRKAHFARNRAYYILLKAGQDPRLLDDAQAKSLKTELKPFGEETLTADRYKSKLDPSSSVVERAEWVAEDLEAAKVKATFPPTPEVDGNEIAKLTKELTAYLEANPMDARARNLLGRLYFFPLTATRQGLPARSFEIEGGSVQMQGGLFASKQRGSFGRAKDEVSLFLELTNEGKTAVWAEVEFQLPETDKVSREMKVIKLGNLVRYKGALEQVAWDTKYPFKVSVFSSEDRKKTLGAEATYFLFEENDKETFEKSREKLEPNEWAIVVGFREMTSTSLKAEVKGTRADSNLRRDVSWTLFKEESKSFKECEHHSLKAEAYGDTKSVIVAKMGEEGKHLEEKLRSKGEMFIEKWWVQSCETVSIYEVLLVRSPQGGTDIMVERLERGPAAK
jgi:hypothetical protein